MSLGSISTEAHTTLAIAMNRIGGKSNTGEGGEDPARYRAELQRRGDRRRHALRDIIGKGDVVVDYPAQGGRLAALEDQAGRLGPLRRHRRVPASRRPAADQDGAGREARRGRPAARRARCPSTSRKLRYSVPGVGLISPPPHHDIYSIEDLAQLIHDLKNANPQASDQRQARVRGRRRHGRRRRREGEGRPRRRSPATTAAPARRRGSSIKHAGTPWELGLAETQQTLVLNRLRGRIARAGRRPDEDRPRRRHRRAARRRRVRLRDRAAGRRGLHHDAQVPPQHLPGRRRDAGSGAAREVRRPARARRQLLLLRRRGSARDHGAARRPHVRRADRPRRPARHAARASSTGRRAASTSRACSCTHRRCRPRSRAAMSRSRTTASPRRSTSS